MSDGSGPGINLVSAFISTTNYLSEWETSEKYAAIEEENIRSQQVQLRIRENQESIARMKSLEKILATEEVMTGFRNISGASGSVRALTIENMDNFYADEDAAALNYAAKQQALARQLQIVGMKKDAQEMDSFLNFGKNMINQGQSYYQSQNLNNLAKQTAYKPAPQTNDATSKALDVNRY